MVIGSSSVCRGLAHLRVVYRAPLGMVAAAAAAVGAVAVVLLKPLEDVRARVRAWVRLRVRLRLRLSLRTLTLALTLKTWRSCCFGVTPLLLATW